MKKSNVLQINNQFIQNELQKRRKNDDENRQKTRFLFPVLHVLNNSVMNIL